MEKQNYFSSGEFAKLTGVNKRTLHYYNDIGLFRPAVIGENGYHYYSGTQFAQLEFILILRRIGLSIEEIRDYLSAPSDASFSQILDKKKKLIDNSIKQLLSIQAFLNQKADRIQLSMQAQHGAVEICTLPERRIILSSPIAGTSDDEDFSVAAAFSLRLKRLFSLYDSFGSRISTDALGQNGCMQYDRYFAYCPEGSPIWDEVLPGGTYLQSFCIGPWDRLPDIYRKILIYAEDHHLQLCGYAYEEGLNEMSLRSMDEYMTRITVAVKSV